MFKKTERVKATSDMTRDDTLSNSHKNLRVKSAFDPVQYDLTDIGVTTLDPNRFLSPRYRIKSKEGSQISNNLESKLPEDESSNMGMTIPCAN